MSEKSHYTPALGGIPIHNKMRDIQGGTEDERYHLTEAEHKAVEDLVGETESFGIIDVDNGTNPAAEIANDTLTITSGDSTISVTGNATTNTVDIRMASAASSAFYKEFSYTSSVLTTIGIWSDSSKTTKLFTKTFTYVSGDLSTLVIYDEVALSTLTKTFHYDVDGNLDYINEVIT